MQRATINDRGERRCPTCGELLATMRTDLRFADGTPTIQHLAVREGMVFDQGVYRISNRAQQRIKQGKPVRSMRPANYPRPTFRDGNLYILVPVNDRFVLELRASPVAIECPRCKDVHTVAL